MATGKYPYPKFRTIFDQISIVVNGPAPLLTPEEHGKYFSLEFIDFVNSCLNKDAKRRPVYSELLVIS